MSKNDDHINNSEFNETQTSAVFLHFCYIHLSLIQKHTLSFYEGEVIPYKGKFFHTFIVYTHVIVFFVLIIL